MDYSQLSDFEINKRVAVLAGIAPGKVYQVNSKNGYDPCNNAAEAYPVIYKNGISIGIYGYGEWGAGTINHTHIDGVNPLRAAMIVFLQMQDVKHA